MSVTVPKGYKPALNIRQTEVAIKKVKDFFERDLAIQLNLTRVSAPLFVDADSGLNDNLNGVERPVSFDIKGMNGNNEIVQSLAKWKRMALDAYGFEPGEGLYTEMRIPTISIRSTLTNGTGKRSSRQSNAALTP